MHDSPSLPLNKNDLSSLDTLKPHSQFSTASIVHIPFPLSVSLSCPFWKVQSQPLVAVRSASDAARPLFFLEGEVKNQQTESQISLDTEHTDTQTNWKQTTSEEKRGMAEEHKCQTPPEGHRLCANNCGFFGSPATLNLCSKCYRDLHLNSPTTHPITPSPSSPPPLSLKPPTPDASPPQLTTLPSSSSDTVCPPSPSLGPMRCGMCRKRVGLTGFRCRCGNTFCGNHRHPEQHTCGFDFKSMGKDAIARANPIVKATKLDRI